MNERLEFRLSLSAPVLAVALLLLPALAAASGLHQPTLDRLPEMQAAFHTLAEAGRMAVVAGFICWFVPWLLRCAPATQALWRVTGAMLWVFGAAAALFGALPLLWRLPQDGTLAQIWPLGFFLLSLLALAATLDASDALRNLQLTTRTRAVFALMTSLWLAGLIVFVAAPIAYAGSLAWGRGSGVSSAADHLLGDRYWHLGCLSGRGACGAAVNSLALGIAASGLAGVLGAALALFVHQSSRRIRRGMTLLACLPMLTPPFLIGFGLAQLFGKAGLFSVAVESLFSIVATRWFFGPWGVLFAQTLVFFPLAYFMVLGALDALGRAEIDAARFLGASAGDVLRSVVWPTLRDPLAAAALVIFIDTLSDVGNPLLIGGKLRVLATELFHGCSGELSSGETAVVPGLLLAAITLAMTLLKGYLVGRKRPGGNLPAAAEHGRCELPTPLRWACGSLLALTVVLLALVYLMIFIGAFSEGGKIGASFTLDNFTRGFGVEAVQGALHFSGSAWESLFASLLCACLVAPVGSLLGMVMVWVLGRVGAPASRLVNGLSSGLLSVPSVVVGAGFVLVFGGQGLSQGGVWALILLAMLIRNLAVCLRFGGVALRRVARPQLEISALLGAGSLTTFRRITAPALRPAFLICAAYGFVRSMTMLGSVLLLSSAENQVATTYMIDRIGFGEFGVGMAYGVVLAVCIAAILSLGAWAVACGWGKYPSGGWRAALRDLRTALVMAQQGAGKG